MGCTGWYKPKLGHVLLNAHFWVSSLRITDSVLENTLGKVRGTWRVKIKYITWKNLVMHCTALHFTVMHCTALRFNVLHCTELHCSALYYTALHCTELHCTALPCTALHCDALHCIVLHCKLCVKYCISFVRGKLIFMTETVLQKQQIYI